MGIKQKRTDFRVGAFFVSGRVVRLHTGVFHNGGFVNTKSYVAVHLHKNITLIYLFHNTIDTTCGDNLLALCERVTEVVEFFLLFALGFRTGHYSADYYPMIPWVFLFLAGGFLGRLFARGTVPEVFRKNPVPALSWLGRHTMIIYLLHQPVVYGVMAAYFSLTA